MPGSGANSSLNWRPEIEQAMYPDPPVDALGRQAPRRLQVLGYLRAMPQLWRAFSRIPNMAWSVDVNDDGYSVALVSCPCGNQTCIEVGALESCDDAYHKAVVAAPDGEGPDAAEFRCPRSYLFLGAAVYVANSPHRGVD